MNPLDLRTLLGGYAAGTLTPQERELLFQAALEDQALFDALADEEALRELLAEPGARAQLLAVLREAPAGFWDRAGRWLRKPATLAFATSAVALVLVVGVVRYARPDLPAPKMVAHAPAVMEPPVPAGAAVPEKAQSEAESIPPGPPHRFVPPPAAVTGSTPASVPEGLRGPEPREGQAAVALRDEATAAPPAARQPDRDLEAKLAPAPPREKAAGELREQAAAAAPAAPTPAAPSYAVQVRDPGGSWRDTPPGTTFRGGDQTRLRIRPAEDGYILLTVQDGSISKALTPGAGEQVKAGQELFVPASGGLELEGVSGEKVLRLSFSTAPLPTPPASFRFARTTTAPVAAQKTETDIPRTPEPRVIDIRLRYGPQ